MHVFVYEQVHPSWPCHTLAALFSCWCAVSAQVSCQPRLFVATSQACLGSTAAEPLDMCGVKGKPRGGLDGGAQRSPGVATVSSRCGWHGRICSCRAVWQRRSIGCDHEGFCEVPYSPL